MSDPKFTNCMIDFEAFGTGKNPCLSQVGAVYFDPTSGELGPEFSANIDAASHQKAGGILDAETVYWWLNQSKEAISTLLTNKQDVTKVMTDLNEFLKDAKYVWSHATFDYVLLQNTFKQLGIKSNVSYKAGLDIRTLIHLAGTTTNRVRAGTHHNGLDDCKHQVKYCVEAITKLKLNKQAIKAIMNLGVVNE